MTTITNQPYEGGPAVSTRRRLCGPRGGASLLVIAAALLPAGEAGAQQAGGAVQQQAGEADTVALEEIVVTGTKRGAQRLQDVPMAVNAISGENLDEMGASNFMDYALTIPGMQVQDLGPGDKEYIIRGANSSGASTAGVYFGEAVITGRNKEDGGGRQPDPKLFDVERVEVLKGPQGTLYGASSLTGTIRIVPNEPEPTTFAGSITAEGSHTDMGDENYEFHGWLNIPVIENKFAIRAVGYVVDNSGYIDQRRLDNDNINSESTEGGRLHAKWWITPDITLSAMLLAQDMDIGGSSRFTPGNDFFVGEPPAGFTEVEGGDLINVDFTESPWREDMRVYGGTFEWRSDYGTLLATTNFFERKINFRFDGTPILFFLFDGLAGVAPPIGLDEDLPNRIPPSVTTQPQERTLLSNEIRFSSDLDGPFNFVAGAFLSREEKDFNVEVFTANGLGQPAGPFGTTQAEDGSVGADGIFFNGDEGASVFGRTRFLQVDEEALFADATFEAVEGLTFTAGIRWFQSEVSSDERETKPFAGFPPADGPVTQSLEVEDDSVTFRAGVDYKVTPDHLVYFMFSQGFRAASLNDFGIPQVAQIPQQIDNDELDNFEVGVKTSWWDDRLTINAAYFHTDWDDVRVEIRDRTEAFKFLGNGGDAEIDGVEADLTVTPLPGLLLNASATWMNARIVEDSPFAAGVPNPDGPPFRDPNAGIAGDEFPNIPDWSFSVSGSYERPVADTGWTAMGRFDWIYRGDRTNQFRPFQVDMNGEEILSPDGDRVPNPFFVELESYNLLNLRTAAFKDEWRVEVFLENVTDKRAEVDAIRTNQDPLAFLTVRPRTVGGRVSYSF